jgi:long-chain fatty acid transport protein
MLLLGVAAFVICAAGAARAGGYMLSAVGDRARSMGGAFTGLADDWSAVYYNPAGAAMLQGSEIYFSGAAFSPRASFVPNLSSDGWPVNNTPPGSYVNLEKTYVVPQGGGYAKLPDTWGMSIGLGIFSPLDNNITWGLFEPPYKTGQSFLDKDVESDINVWTFQPTLGYEVIPDQLSLGAGISLQYGEVDNRRVVLVPNEVENYNDRPYDYFYTDANLVGDGWGLGYNLGALAKMEMWSLGVSFRGESVVKLDGTSQVRFWGMDDRDNGRGVITDPLLIQDLFGGKVITKQQATEFELTLPPTFSAGLAFVPNERFTFTGDFAYTWYSQASGLIATENDEYNFRLGETADSVNVPVSISEHYDWKDQYRVSAGILFNASERLQLRAGGFFEPSAIRTSSLTPLYTDIGDKLSPSVGLSMNVGKYTLSYAYGIVFYGSRTVDTWTDSSLPGKYDNVQHESFFSMRYRW